MDKDIQTLGRFDHFPEETGCKAWFFRRSASTKKRKEEKKKNLSVELSPKEFSTILTISAPKWRQSAGTWKFSSNATFSSTEAPLDETLQIVRK